MHARRTGGLAALLALVLGVAFSVPAPAAPSVRDRELRASVTVSGACSATCRGTVFGAGEIVGRRDDGDLIVVTARHIVDGTSSPRIFFHSSDPRAASYRTLERRAFGVPAVVLARASDADLALLTFRPMPAGVSFSFATFAAGAAVTGGAVVGGPYGKLWTVSPYRYSSAADDGSFLIECASCGPGDSGGGVFDAAGGLTGILVSEQRLLEGNSESAAGVRTLRFRVIATEAIASLLNVTHPEGIAPSELRVDPWSRFSANPK